jgi:Bacterial regulatory proteins, luxR family
MGSQLGVSIRTVETHIGNLFGKLGVRSRLQAMRVGATLNPIALDGSHRAARSVGALSVQRK